jgi:hypothetical protein
MAKFVKPIYQDNLESVEYTKQTKHKDDKENENVS